VYRISDLIGPADDSPVSRDLRTEAEDRRGDKPLWSPADAIEAAWELARGGAAVTRGEILDLSSGVPERVPLEPWMTEQTRVILWPSTPGRNWSTSRADGEPRADFAHRAAARAADEVRRLTGMAARPGMMVDLAWVTEDEIALFRLPRASREHRARVLEKGGPARIPWSPDTWRVTEAAPLAGSFYGRAATTVRDIPADAELARVGRATRHLKELRQRQRLSTVVITGAKDAHLASLPASEGIRDLSVEGKPTTLAPLAALTGLESLDLRTERALKDDAPLAPLAGLHALRSLHLRPAAMRDLASLPPLAGLTTFVFRSFADRIESLAPLGALTGLRYLMVSGPRVRDPSLAPLASLRRLRWMGLWTGAFPLAEYARLAASLPDAGGTLRGPLQRPEPAGYAVPRCPACRGEMVQTLGAPRKTFCPACEPERAIACHAEWEALRSAGPW
jgi:hypothetical protein